MGKPISDKERILTAIIKGLESASILCRHGDPYNEASWTSPSLGTSVHFARYRAPVRGDLVIGQTGRNDTWKIAFYEEFADPSVGLHVVRHIDTGQLCNYGNESFTPIVGLSYTELLVGEKRKVYNKVLGAFARGDEYLYRFGGIKIEDAELTITVREWHGGLGHPSKPFDITMPWTPKTTIKAILSVMREGGYGTKSFRPPVTPQQETQPS